MSIDDRIRWDQRYRYPKREPSNHARQLLMDHFDLLPREGIVLEVAMGIGQNAKPLLEHGLKVIGVDISLVAVQKAKQTYPNLMATVADLNHLYFPSNYFDVVLNFYYLQRDLWKDFFRILKPGGILFLETLTQDIQSVRSDIATQYLLNPKELTTAFSNWSILYSREGWIDSYHGQKKAIASIIAQKPVINSC